MIRTTLDWISAATSLPRPVLSLIAGLLITWAATQRLKFFLPSTWSPKAREFAVQSIAAVVGFTATFFTWEGSVADSAVAAAVVGFASPLLWNALMLVIGWKWPALRDRLSQANRQ